MPDSLIIAFSIWLKNFNIYVYNKEVIHFKFDLFIHLTTLNHVLGFIISLSSCIYVYIESADVSTISLPASMHQCP